MLRTASALCVLLALAALLGPFCGSLLAIACPEECCCGKALGASCGPGECVMSQPAGPASAAGSAVQEPTVAAHVLVPAYACGIVVEPPRPEFVTSPIGYLSLPDLYLQHHLLLI